MAKNRGSNLHSAKRAKNDEFYTRLSDIENELKHYKHHFKDKVVYCNCDDPKVSNFFKYFALNFKHLGLKKLITSCYRNTDPDVRTKGVSDKAVWLEYTGGDYNTIEEIRDNTVIHEFEGDGDFRSDESIELLKESDIVVTNGPFSLYREYVQQLMDYNKDFLIIGNNNSISYREIFPLIRDDVMWMGVSPRGMDFVLPDGSFKNVNANWFTTLDHAKRHEGLILFKRYNPKDYPKYDNYDAININKTKDIPVDYEGLMGVPITFLDKYDPEQFEIIGLSRYVDTDGMSADFVEAYYASGQKGQISEGHPDLCYYDNDGRPAVPYMRVIIKHKS